VLASFTLAAIVEIFATAGAGVEAGAKDWGAGGLASFILAAIVETFAAAGCGIEAGAAGLGESTFLTSIEELLGAIRGDGAAGEESSALFAAGDLLVFLTVSFSDFIFMFTRLFFLFVERNNQLLPSILHGLNKKAEKVPGSNKYFFAPGPGIS